MCERKRESVMRYKVSEVVSQMISQPVSIYNRMIKHIVYLGTPGWQSLGGMALDPDPGNVSVLDILTYIHTYIPLPP